MQKAQILATAGELILMNRLDEAEQLIGSQYRFEEYIKPKKAKTRARVVSIDNDAKAVERRYTQQEALDLYISDGFTDRYFGVQLVCPAALYALSRFLPNAFPCGDKRSTTHQAFWDLFPSLDHLDPVSHGGVDEEWNWVTTSMNLNLKKSNISIEELGWEVLPSTGVNEWDGMMSWYGQVAEIDNGLSDIRFNKAWHRCTMSSLVA